MAVTPVVYNQPITPRLLNTLTGALQGMMANIAPAVSVLDYGAIPDGATDNTAAFQAAIDTGKSVFVPPSATRYNIDGTLTFASGTGRKLFSTSRGAGGGATLYFTGTGTGDCVVFGTTSSECSMPEVCDIDIQAPSRTGGSAIRAVYTYRMQINRVRIQNVYNAYLGNRALGTCISDGLFIQVRGDYGVASISTEAAPGDIMELTRVTVAGHSSIISSPSGKRCTALYLDSTSSILVHGFKALNGCGTGLRSLNSGGLAFGGGFGNLHLFACEFMADDGIVLETGNRWVFTSPYIFGTKIGAGVVIEPAVTNVQFIGGDIASNEAGGAIVKTEGVCFTGVCIALNGPNPYIHDGIEIEGTAKHVRIIGCQIGRRSTAQGGQRYGVRIDAGAEDVQIIGCNFTGNVTGRILDNATAGQVILRGNTDMDDNTDQLTASGTGDVRLANAGGDIFRAVATGTVSGRLTLSAGVAGSPVTLFAEGTDADIPVSIATKGAGLGRLRHGSTDALTWDGTRVDARYPLRLPSYTVATVPSVATHARSLIYVSDGAGDKRLAIAGTVNWLWPDGTVVS